MAKGFLGLNPTANGILIGSLVGGPVLGAAVGALYDYYKGQKRDAKDAYQSQYKAGVQNENSLMLDSYNKKLQARGLGEMAANAGAASSAGTGMEMAQQGSVLSSDAATTKTQNILG